MLKTSCSHRLPFRSFRPANLRSHLASLPPKGWLFLRSIYKKVYPQRRW